MQPDLTDDHVVADLALGGRHWPGSRAQLLPGRTKRICGDIGSALKLQFDICPDAYGHGTASFTDVFFYREAPREVRPMFRAVRRDIEYVGLQVLLHKSFPMYVIGEGRWSGSGIRSLPSWDYIDLFLAPAVAAHGERTQRKLDELGLVRLSRDVAARRAPEELSATMHTSLSHGGLRVFDAFFWWSSGRGRTSKRTT